MPLRAARFTAKAYGAVIFDYGVIGGGIIGLASASAILSAHPGASVVVLEKDSALARHQTGHNSGVIHAGVYYAPGSLKARLCRKGAEMTKAFARAHGIPFETCGKLLVATTAAECQRMEALATRAADNGLSFERLDRSALRAREPWVRGRAALFVRETGIIDYGLFARALGAVIEQAGGQLWLNSVVSGICETAQSVELQLGTGDSLRVRRLVVCGGVQADRLARLAGVDIPVQIVPFRGEYYRLSPKWNGRFQHLIYPIPDPDLPFLGIHLTRMIDGTVTVGPNAVLGRARDGDAKPAEVWRDLAETLSFAGFWRMVGKNLRPAVDELHNSIRKTHYLRACQKYCPALTRDDLRPMAAGIRAQAVARDGTLVHDFEIVQTPRSVFVLNAPSPAATSALPIGDMIAERLGA